MKGLVLAGGQGTRARPLAYARPKQLLPVANKPIIDYAVGAIIALGIREVGIVVGESTAAPLRAHLGDGSRWGASFTYIVQPQQRGLADCVLCAQEFLAGEEFLMYLGDNLFQDPLDGLISAFRAAEANAAVALAPVADPRAFGVAEVDSAGRVRRLVEKPAQPSSNLAVVGAYVFDASIVGAAHQVTPSPRGELEITDAIQLLVDSGRRVISYRVRGWWKDAGTPHDLLEVNRLVLDGLQASTGDGAVVDGDSRVCGAVAIGAGARVAASEVAGPVVIGEGAAVLHAQVGPYVAVGPGSRVEGVHIEDCVVMEEARLLGAGTHLVASLIGARARVEAGPGQALELVIPDRSRVRVRPPRAGS
ncbi:MAG: glucose-1-phosphate thymidylyltransferase [Candidatus Bipolaricaulaceae bacterium]